MGLYEVMAPNLNGGTSLGMAAGCDPWAAASAAGAAVSPPEAEAEAEAG